ncbi:DUF5994 family protein [Saccharothrix obliqua]|uniref:DUF5994 family protein n=1 Tax=Saccharothrix obliqua TaxID=2861747 RepID=UPI001C5E98A8|nr:DUF5994 family protein [Saccharothrix obliqua]MBW4722330.1 hypothetical protein [Saccharothrix obliqua]
MTLELLNPPAETTLRLSMKPEGSSGGAVDGAWWPRSADPTTEFPPLLAVLGAAGQVRRVTYHLDSWERADRKLEAGDITVRMEGFHSIQPDTVTLVNSDYTRIRLLVVPPGTPGGVARAVLRSAATSNATVEDILSSNGATPRTNPEHAPRRTRGTIDEDRWEGDGGHF